VLSLSAAALPAGRSTMLQLKLSRSPSASLLALPSRCTVSPTCAAWSTPALATGGVFSVLMNTVAGRLSSSPSLTTSYTT